MLTNKFASSVGSRASYNRLEKLLIERLQPGADKRDIDTRIWELFGEEWTILFTDLAGFSRHVAEFGIIHFLQTIYESERLFVPIIEQHGGILLKVEGDSMMVIFRRAESALQCAVTMQQAAAGYNRGREESEQVLLCAGLGFGKVLRIGDADVFGAEVNVASKLGEDSAEAGEILLTGAVYEKVAMMASSSEYSFERLSFAPPGADEAYRLIYQ